MSDRTPDLRLITRHPIPFDECDPDPFLTGASLRPGAFRLAPRLDALTSPDPVPWSQLEDALLEQCDLLGVLVARRPLSSGSGGGACVWIDAVPTIVVESRLSQHREVVEVLAHELGHALAGIRVTREEPQHVREVAADVFGSYVAGVLVRDLGQWVVPLGRDIVRLLWTVVAAELRGTS